MSLKKKFATALLSSGIVLGAAYSSTAAAAAPSYINIGTGGQTGVYYVVGQSICRLLNRGTKNHGIKCTAPSTGGSVANINAIRDGSQDMGVAQSDWQFHGYNGTKNKSFIEQGAFKELRALFSVHPEPFTVVARADSGIKTFDDLRGKRVNIGNPGSGSRGTMEVVMQARGWSKDDFKLAAELKSSEQSQALCDNKIDAMLFNAGHPNGSIKEATTSCDAVIVPVEGSDIESLINGNDYYAPALVPGGMYRGSEADVATFGNMATFVSSSKVDADVVYQLVKTVFDNIDRFKSLHPAFARLNPREMISNGLSAPLHEGAVRYYKERGWM